MSATYDDCLSTRIRCLNSTIDEDRLADAAPDLLAALAQLVSDWESVPEDVQVPDEINVDDHWNSAREAIAKTKPPS